MTLRKILTFTLLVFTCLALSAAKYKSASIKFKKFDHKGSDLTCHFEMHTSGYKGKKFEVAIYFYDENKKPLKDKNNRYCSVSGQVSALAETKSNYEDSMWDDFKVSIPRKEIDCDHKAQTLYMVANLWRGNEVVAQTGYIPFTMENSRGFKITSDGEYYVPTATIEYMTIEPDAIVNDKHAIKVSYGGNLKNMHKNAGDVRLWILGPNGDFHKVSSSRQTSDGTKFFEFSIKGESENFNYNRWLSAAHEKLNLLPGKNTYWYKLTIHNYQGKKLAESDWKEFTLTGPTKTASTTSSSSNRTTSSSSSSSTKSKTTASSSKSSSSSKFNGSKIYYLIQCLTMNGYGGMDVVNNTGDVKIDMGFDDGVPYIMNKNGAWFNLAYDRSENGIPLYSCNGNSNHLVGINLNGELVEVMQVYGVVQRNVYSTTAPNTNERWETHVPTPGLDNSFGGSSNSSSSSSSSKSRTTSTGVCQRCHGTKVDPILVDYSPGSRTKTSKIPAYTKCPHCGQTLSCDHWHQRCLDCSTH